MLITILKFIAVPELQETSLLDWHLWWSAPDCFFRLICTIPILRLTFQTVSCGQCAGNPRLSWGTLPIIWPCFPSSLRLCSIHLQGSVYTPPPRSHFWTLRCSQMFISTYLPCLITMTFLSLSVSKPKSLEIRDWIQFTALSPDFSSWHVVGNRCLLNK